MNVFLSFWSPIHKKLTQNQDLIKGMFFAAYCFITVLLIAGFYLFNNNIKIYFLIAELANLAGTLSLILFLTTLLPGIFKRMKILPLFSASIVLFRRQLGILMYFFALLHSFYLSTIPFLSTPGISYRNFSSHEILGSLSVLLLFPVWITSNDLSQRLLGKFWKLVQRLTYIALVFIFLHVARTELSKALLVGIVALAEVSSWIVVSRGKKVTKQPISSV